MMFHKHGNQLHKFTRATIKTCSIHHVNTRKCIHREKEIMRHAERILETCGVTKLVNSYPHMQQLELCGETFHLVQQLQRHRRLLSQCNDEWGPAEEWEDREHIATWPSNNLLLLSHCNHRTRSTFRPAHAFLPPARLTCPGRSRTASFSRGSRQGSCSPTGT